MVSNPNSESDCLKGGTSCCLQPFFALCNLDLFHTERWVVIASPSLSLPHDITRPSGLLGAPDERQRERKAFLIVVGLLSFFFRPFVPWYSVSEVSALAHTVVGQDEIFHVTLLICSLDLVAHKAHALL